MARPQEVTNLHILGFLSDRTDDIAKLGDLLHVQKSEGAVEVSCNKRSLKRKRSMISIKKRTSSYMRYKLPRVVSKKKKKGKLSTPGRQCEPRCRRERRNRSLLRELHSVELIEANEFPLKYDQKALPRWLETHFWNRKRFVTKMCWGYCLPIRHKARGKRFVQSAVKDTAVIHDSSYIRPIQIVGYYQNILELLRQITDPSIELIQQDQSSSSADSTCTEIPIILYKRNQFPSGCLGPASVCFTSAAPPDPVSSQQADGIDDKLMQAWVWCHPALFSDTLRELLEINADAGADQSCEISCVRGGVQRFSVRGQGSLALLGKVLRTEHKSKDLNSQTAKDISDMGHSDMEESNEDFFRSVLTYQPFSRIWKENVSLGLLVKDVRRLTNYHKNAQLHECELLALTSLRVEGGTGSLNDSTPLPCDELKKKLVWPAASSISPLWSDHQRRECSRRFLKDDAINKKLYKLRQLNSCQIQHRHDEETFHNETSVNAAPKEDVSSPFPVVIIRKDMKNYSSKRMKSKKGLPFLGFDILLPSGWGAAVWRAFQFAGAIAIGIEELESIQLDHGVASFPRDYPDTEAGRAFWRERASSLEKLDLLKPPRKRVGINGLEVPRWDRDGLLWQACSTDDCSSSNRGNRDCAEEERELNDSHADCHTGGREIINPESDDGGKSNSECNRNSSSSSSSCVTDMIIGTDTDLIECVEVPDPSTINSCPDIPCIEMRVMDTALTEFSSDERQTLDFNVIREERYVRAFRLEFMSRSNEMDAREVDEAFLYSLMSAGGDKNRGDVKKENFCTRNNQMFYSLMECLASKPLMCLPLQSLLPVLLVPTGRGVCRDGAVIFMPSKDDYLEFVYYHEKRAESSLSSSRQANKRLGEWRGVDSNIPKDLQDARKEESLNTCTRCDVSDHDPMCEASSPGSGGRGLIGYVTSGRYCGSPCGSVSYGFCDATLLQEMAISAAKLLLEYQGVGTAGSRSPPRGRVLSLVMFRSPRSRWLRPALVDIISILQ